ncbi:dna ligase 1/3 family member [Holotrichia oblita]|uniref:Dna ligase 1/3 family member n=1 Tax=Holotrichia oblita TaxID=644536 RepID=A0ACB9SW12_HOLOL|nr:dna ligase 1/3 family member [Holotrichia oblita]
MSDNETSDKRLFFLDKAKRSRAICKTCKRKCLTGELRIAKIVPEVNGNDKKKNWYHIECIFEEFQAHSMLDKIIEDLNDLNNLENMSESDKKMLEEIIQKNQENIAVKKNGVKTNKDKIKKVNSFDKEIDIVMDVQTTINVCTEKDGRLLFKPVCALITKLPRCVTDWQRTCAISNTIFGYGIFNKHVLTEMKLISKLLVPDYRGALEYRIPPDDITNIFKKLFGIDEIVTPPNSDIAISISECFAKNRKYKPVTDGNLTLKEVVDLIEGVRKAQDEENKIRLFKQIVRISSVDELKMIVRLMTRRIKLDINLKHVLDIIHPECYPQYQINTHMGEAVKKYIFTNEEIRYYIQYARPNLAPKHPGLYELLYTAFPYANQLIADCELIPVDLISKKFIEYKPGTTCSLCLLIHDCMFVNEDLTKKPLRLRRQYLNEMVSVIDNKAELSQLTEIKYMDQLNPIISELLRIPREFFTNQDRVYLDLFVGGAWVDVDDHGKLITIFLMCLYDPEGKTGRSVVRLGIEGNNGIDVEGTMQLINCDSRLIPDWLKTGSLYNTPQYILPWSPVENSKAFAWKISGIEVIYDADVDTKISLLYPRFEHVQPHLNSTQTTTISELIQLFSEKHPEHKQIIEETGQPPLNIEETPSTSFAETPDEPRPLLPTPQYFKNIRLYLDEEMEGKHVRWVRFFSECGGTLVENHEEATHIMHYRDVERQESRERWNLSVKHVIIEWVKDTILKGALQEEGIYRVQTIP